MCLIVFFYFHSANALTIEEFKKACHDFNEDCASHPILNAYIGGALDLVASLQEETHYVKKLYCHQSEQLFDIKNIIKFVENTSSEHNHRNAMLGLIFYFEENGAC